MYIDAIPLCCVFSPPPESKKKMTREVICFCARRRVLLDTHENEACSNGYDGYEAGGVCCFEGCGTCGGSGCGEIADTSKRGTFAPCMTVASIQTNSSTREERQGIVFVDANAKFG